MTEIPWDVYGNRWPIDMNRIRTTPEFALIGAAGYVAPRHMQAIKDVGGKLVAALDPHDSVGILDKHFPECLYFREPERFDRWLSKNPVDFVVVASPNYLHDSHCLMAMRNGANVICEKPLCCNERNLDNLAEWELKTGRRINAILQCRLHQDVINATAVKRPFSVVRVNYRTPRGQWYDQSWKMDVEKSGGLPTNIGVHLFDLCSFIFGNLKENGVIESSSYVKARNAGGVFELENAIVQWNLSIEQGPPTRVFDLGGEMLDLTTGFTDLHTKSYQEILAGNGFGIEDTRQAIRIVERIRNA